MWTDRRWRSLALATSLLLNIFLVGTVAGHLIGVDRQAGGLRPEPGIVPGAHIRALPPEEKRRFLAVMKDRRDGIRAARQAHRAAREAVEAAIAEPTYDRDVVAAKFAALRQTNVALQEAVNAALVDALQNLSQQARASLVHHARPGTAVPAAQR